MKYLILTNDRGKKKGVAMYSGFKHTEAESPEEALRSCPPRLNGCPPFASAKAVPLAPIDRSEADKRWLRKHVGK